MNKRLFALLVIIGMLSCLTADAQFRRGAVVGVDVTDLKFKQDLLTVDQSVGFSAGFQGELMFPGIGFGVDFGVMYAQKGATMHMGEKKIWASEGLGNERVYLHYLSIPVHFRFKYTRLGGIEEYVAPLVFGGPEFSILAGHGSIKSNGESAIKYAGGDLGLTVGGGFEIMKNWQLTYSYTWGMTYSLKTRLLDDFSARNRAWNVRLAYYF